MYDMIILIKKLRTQRWLRNASPSEDDDGAMIRYWEEQTGIDLNGSTWVCPKCGLRFDRLGLDGAHVVSGFLGRNHPQFITPLCHKCNRSHDDQGFWVKKENVIPAP